jgi:hypothetical protein
MNLEINVKLEELAYGLSCADQTDLVELIVATDSIIAEVEFTERLLLKLAETLSGDLETDEKAVLISKLIDIMA